MQPLKIDHIFVYILGLRMVDVVCTFPEFGDQKFMKTHPILRETPLNGVCVQSLPGADFRERAKNIDQNRNNNNTQAYVFVKLDFTDLWLRGLGAYLN